MEEKILSEVKAVKELLKAYINSQEQNDDRIVQMLANIEGRLYSIEEDVIWLKNGGNHQGDAKGPAGVPGL